MLIFGLVIAAVSVSSLPSEGPYFDGNRVEFPAVDDAEELNKPSNSNKEVATESSPEEETQTPPPYDGVEELNIPDKRVVSASTVETEQNRTFLEETSQTSQEKRLQDAKRYEDENRSTQSNESAIANAGNHCSAKLDNNAFWVTGKYFANLSPPTENGFYYDNRDCYYYFYSPAGTKTQANCRWLRVVSPDSLALHGGSKTNDRYITLTGVRGAFKYTSSQNYLFMRFYSNANVRWNGFDCVVRAV